MKIHTSDPALASAKPVRWPGFTAGLLGGLYVLGITLQYPLSVSPDGTYYLEMAAQLQVGNGPRFHDDVGNLQLVTHWPPLYPVFVAGVGLLLGLEPLPAARILAALCLGITLVILDKILVRLGQSVMARCLGLGLLFASLPFVVFTKALSDGLLLALLLAMTLLLLRWQETSRSGLLLLAGIAAGMMVLTRYAAVGLAAGAGLFLLTRPVSFSRRLHQVLTFGVPVLLLSGAWVAYILLDGGESNRRTVTFHLVSGQHVVGLVKTGLLWLSPAWRNMGFLILALMVGLGILLIRDHPRFWSQWTPAPFRLFGWLSGMYFIFLLFSISFIDFYTPLNYRILAPVFLLVAFLSLPVWQLSLSAIRTRRLAIAILLVMGVSYLWAFSQRSEEYFQHGNHYTSEIWTKSPTLAYLDRVPLDRHVYTNGPDPIRLFHQRYRGLFMLPVRFEVTSQRVNPDFERDMEDLHEKLRDGQAVLVYFEAIERPSLPDTAELRARFLDIPIQRLEDGFALGQAGP